MHELAICQAIVDQVLQIARPLEGRLVAHIGLSIGPLAGVEPALLRAAFPLVAAGGPCVRATLEIDIVPVRVLCSACGMTSEARPNRLLCAGCGAWRVKLVSGDEMLLTAVTFEAAIVDRPDYQESGAIHV